MVDDRNIDKWDLEQIFPPIAKEKCPYCASGETYDPETVIAKLLRFLVFSFRAGPSLLFNEKRRKLAAYRRRKCRECGFEYSVEQVEPVLIVIGAIAAVAAVVAAIASAYCRVPK